VLGDEGFITGLDEEDSVGSDDEDSVGSDDEDSAGSEDEEAEDEINDLIVSLLLLDVSLHPGAVSTKKKIENFPETKIWRIT
jgi:hypothetical protein